MFDFIEEAHERGEPLREALLDAGIVRLRPVMVTVGATVLGLVPLGTRPSALGTAVLRANRRVDHCDPSSLSYLCRCFIRFSCWT